MAYRVTFEYLIVVNATLLATTITGPTVLPSSIKFSSPDPDITPVSGNTPATIVWTMTGNKHGNWSLAVQAAAASLTSCPAVPVSAIKVQCTSAIPTGGGGPNATCTSGALTLSTAAQTLASGINEGDPGTITVNASFTFTDAWRYPASSACSVQLTYTITAQ